LLKRSTQSHQSQPTLKLLSNALKALDEVAGNNAINFNLWVLGENYPELKPSYRHALKIRTQLEIDNISELEIKSSLRCSLENSFLIRYMPGVVTDLFNVLLFPFVNKFI
jgi:hypothetical protein